MGRAGDSFCTFAYPRVSVRVRSDLYSPWGKTFPAICWPATQWLVGQVPTPGRGAAGPGLSAVGLESALGFANANASAIAPTSIK